MPSLSGQILLNQYRIEEFVESTPLGELYRAVDIRHDRSFALTLLPKTIYENKEALKELEAESNRLRVISHPNLIPYHGIFQTSTNAFLLEDWIDGPSLSAIIPARTPVSVNEALIYIKAVCGALEALHKNQLLHLNLAPEMIRINQRGEIFLAGIGAAWRNGDKARERSGKSPKLFFAPEQFTSQPLTPAADIYALAVILYWLTTGLWINGKAAPKTGEAIQRIHLDQNPPAPISLNKDIPDHFSRMTLWALRKKTQDRLKSTTELVSSLALAANVQADSIPLRVTPTTAPLTSNILEGWKYIPPPKPIGLQQDQPPLDERLAALSSGQPKKSRSRVGFLPIFILILILGFISLFWFVRPAPIIVIPTPIQFTPFAADFTPPPSLTPEPRPTEPNGGRIVFTCTRGDFNQLCMINRDGTGLTQVTDMEASNYYPTFTNDGSALLFASNRNGPFDLFLLVFGKKELLQLTDNVGNVVSPDYSPDGRRIAFANRVGENPSTIWMINSDGLNPRQVYAGRDNIVAVAWSPDGERIAYAMSVGIPLEYEIFTMNAEGKDHVRLSEGLQGIGGSLDWSPDGRYLLVSAGPFGDKDIFRLDAVTGEATQLTDGGNNAGASYSPDGRYIVFNTLRNDDQADLYIMRSDGSNQVQLTNHPEPDWGPRWIQ